MCIQDVEFSCKVKNSLMKGREHLLLKYAESRYIAEKIHALSLSDFLPRFTRKLRKLRAKFREVGEFALVKNNIKYFRLICLFDCYMQVHFLAPLVIIYRCLRCVTYLEIGMRMISWLKMFVIEICKVLHSIL